MEHDLFDSTTIIYLLQGNRVFNRRDISRLTDRLAIKYTVDRIENSFDSFPQREKFIFILGVDVDTRAHSQTKRDRKCIMYCVASVCMVTLNA